MTWRERIQTARRRGRFIREDWHDAACWLTCAVGEQRAALPDVVVYVTAPHLRKSKQRPADARLRTLGGARWGFYGAVKRDDFTAAERFLDAIEDRVLELKREASA